MSAHINAPVKNDQGINKKKQRVNKYRYVLIDIDADSNGHQRNKKNICIPEV